MDTKTYNKQNGRRFNSEKETYLWRTHSIIGISQKRHLLFMYMVQLYKEDWAILYMLTVSPVPSR